MTIKLNPNGQGMKLLDEIIHFAEIDPESMADMLGYDPDTLQVGAKELLRAINNVRK